MGYNTNRFLGYDKDEHGNLVINEEEAVIIGRIYKEYLEGKSYQGIAKSLEEDGIKTGSGNTIWWDSTVSSILSNEKYCGDCSEVFKRRQWNANNPSKKTVWQCKGYINKGKDFCSMKTVSEVVLEQAFVEVFNEIKLNKEEILGTVAANIEKVLKSRTDVQQIEKIDLVIEILKEQLKSLMQIKTTEKLDTEVFNEEYASVSQESINLREKKSDLEKNAERIEEI